MPRAVAPFTITVCGLEELASHADRQVSHVLSILDPDMAEPEAFGAYGEHARLELKFHDIIVETPGFLAPQPGHVAQILEFGRDILRDPENVRHLLVHCHAGISRSTASMALLLAQAQPELGAGDVLAQVLHIREKAWPNLRILALGEEQLGRSGEFTSAVAGIYRIQLERRPEIKNFFIDSGRSGEIDIALAAKR
ncbi:MAG: tyrosine phosphatase family protein [Rhodomicrobium sp.]